MYLIPVEPSMYTQQYCEERIAEMIESGLEETILYRPVTSNTPRWYPLMLYCTHRITGDYFVLIHTVDLLAVSTV